MATTKGAPSRYAAPAVVLVLSLMTSVLVWRLFVNARAGDELNQFNKQVVAHADLVERRLNEVVLELTAFSTFFRASDEVTRVEFKTVYDEFASKVVTGGLRNTTFVRFVRDEEVEAFTQSVRADDSLQPGGYPDFSIHPAGSTADHAVVTFVEPPAAVPNVLGFDVYSDPLRRALFDKARDSGELVVSPQIELLGPDAPAGFLVVHPVYRKGDEILTTEERQASFAGAIVSAFDTAQLFASITGENFLQDYDLEVFDGETGDVPIFDSHPEEVDAGTRPGLHDDYEIKLGDRTYTIHVHVRADNPLAAQDALLSGLVLGLGILLSVLASFATYSSVTARARAQRLAERMTVDIVRARDRYQELLEALPDPTVILDKLGRITSVNRAAEDAAGFKRTELVGKFFPRTGLVVPKSIPLTLKNFAISLSGRIHAPYEIDIKSKGGSIRTFEVNSRPVHEDGKTTGVQVLLRDVTRRREILDQVARQTEELQRINKFMVGRELKMAELKQRLEKQNGAGPKG